MFVDVFEDMVTIILEDTAMFIHSYIQAGQLLVSQEMSHYFKMQEDVSISVSPKVF